MHVLVTGGAGYLGSTIVPMLLESGHEVTIYDRFYFGLDILDDVRAAYPDRVHIRQADVRNISAADFEGIDGVIDLAGISNDPACALNPDLTRAINLQGAKKVASTAHEAGVKRLVFASSCSVYGHGEGLSLTETSPINPVTVYAECKVKGEEFLFDLAQRQDDMTITALRLATVFGLSRRMRFDLAVNIMTQHAYIERKIRVDGGGVQWRPFVHVRDVARAFITALEAPADVVHGEVFNVGHDDNNLQIRNLAYRIRDRIPGTEIQMVPSDPDIRTYNVSFAKIREALDYEPEVTVEDGVDEIVQALQDGSLIPDERRWYTLKTYLFLQEVQQTYEAVSLEGRILGAPQEGS